MRRQEFILSFILLALLAYIAGPVFVKIFVASTKVNGVSDYAELKRAMTKGQLMPYLFTLWPTLAIETKRLRDIGYSYHYLIGFMIIDGVLMLVAPTLMLLFALAGLIVLAGVKGNSKGLPENGTGR